MARKTYWPEQIIGMLREAAKKIEFGPYSE
jgi:hypothetical protein